MVAAANGSTGPRTQEGKAASSMNALKHGLTAQTALLPGEDPGEFRDFVWSVIEDLEPRGPVQAELAHRAGVLMWKRRRLEGAEEKALLQLRVEYAEKAADRLDEAEEDFVRTPQDRKLMKQVRAEERRLGAEWDAHQLLADQFGGRRGGALERLARYEQRLSQQIESTIRLILKLQNRKDWQERQQRRQTAPQALPDSEPRPAAGGEPGRPGPDRCAPQRPKTCQDMPPAPPPAPVQNELVVPEPPPPENAPPAPSDGPPDAN